MDEAWGDDNGRQVDDGGGKALARTIFKDQITFDTVQIFANKKNLKTDRVPTPKSNMYYPSGTTYYADFSLSGDIDARATFIRELTHVYQHQKAHDLYVSVPTLAFFHALTGTSPYDYDLTNRDIRFCSSC